MVAVIVGKGDELLRTLDIGSCVVSQETLQSLKTMFAHHRVPQALIIEGDYVKTEKLAHTLAAGLVCQSDITIPCGACGSCIKAKAGSHPDIYIAQGGTASRSFKVDTVRAIRSDAYIRSQEGGYKVYLLLRADSMSAEAQNALLKILEEPPAQTVFILTCGTAQSLLQTICSRSRIITLDRQMEQNPEAEHIAGEIAQALLSVSEIDLLQVTAPLIKDKDLFMSVLEQLTLVLRDACVQRVGGTSCLSSKKEQVNALCKGIPRINLFRLLQVVKETQDAMIFHANITILVTALCAKLRTVAGR